MPNGVPRPYPPRRPSGKTNARSWTTKPRPPACATRAPPVHGRADRSHRGLHQERRGRRRGRPGRRAHQSNEAGQDPPPAGASRDLHRPDGRHARRDRGEDRCNGRAPPGAEPGAGSAGTRLRPEDQAARVRRVLAAVVLAVAALAAPAAARAAEPAPAVPSAAAAIVVDGRNGETMFAKRADARREIASTTKLMTALLALERGKARDVFTAPPYDALPAESRIDLRPGERMTVKDLLKALLLESANDAAVTIAEGVAGSREAFVEEMNERAAELSLADTSYANPIGLDDPQNYSTARDLAALTLRLMRRPRFARIVDMPEAELESGAHARVVDNRNDLIASHPWVTGVKTGHTLEAGEVLVGSARGAGGASVISVVLGEPSEAARDADTLRLLRWGL